MPGIKRVLIVIQTIACSYQYQRKRDSQNRLIAEISDYYMSLQIVSESFKENLGAMDGKTEERITFIQEKGMVQYKDMEKHLGVKSSSLTSWVKKRVMEGMIFWCDESGIPFLDDKDLKRAKSSGKAFIRMSDDYDPLTVAGLPTPFELTGNKDWDRGGKELLLYDLKLNSKKESEVFDGVCQVFDTPINTSKVDEPVNNIKESEDKKTGVYVFDGKQGNGNGNGKCHKQDEMQAEDSEDLEKEFSDLLNDDNIYSNSVTPKICRNGCMYYDGVKKEDKLEEFCWYKSAGKTITTGQNCSSFERRDEIKVEGVMQV